MLEHYFRKPSTVDRIHANWLAPQIEHYVEWMHTQHYAAHNILRRVPLLRHFADFAREKGATDVNSAISLVRKVCFALGSKSELQKRRDSPQSL